MSRKNKGFKIGDRVVYKKRLGTIVNVEYQVWNGDKFHLDRAPVSYEVFFDDLDRTCIVYGDQNLKYADDSDINTLENADKIIFVLGQNGIHGAYISGDKRIKDVGTDYKLGDLKGTLHKALNALLDAGFKQTVLLRWPYVINIFNKETASHINTVLYSMTEEQRQVVELLVSVARATKNEKKED